MSKALNKLSVKQIAAAPPGKHGDGGGLWLVVDAKGRRWVWLYRFAGKRREMGLGAYPTIGLKDARDARDKWQAVLGAGRDPIIARQAERAQEAQQEDTRPTFGSVATDFMDRKEAGWRNPKHRQQWRNTLNTYASALWPLPIEEVGTDDIVKVLEPIWGTKPETAGRVRGRIEAILDAARARGLTPAHQANPARWRGHLEVILPKPKRLTRGHHAALPYKDMPGFMAELRTRDGVAAMALEWTILTAARTGESLGAQWSEIDEAEKVWTVPKERMKGNRPHVVPLSAPAMALLDELKKLGDPRWLFPGSKPDKPLSGMAMEMALRRMKLDVTVHGFRSTFSDWANDETSHAREVIEAALAHVIGDKAERAYRRGTALEKRRALMNDWAAYCTGKQA